MCRCTASSFSWFDGFNLVRFVLWISVSFWEYSVWICSLCRLIFNVDLLSNQLPYKRFKWNIPKDAVEIRKSKQISRLWEIRSKWRIRWLIVCVFYLPISHRLFVWPAKSGERISVTPRSTAFKGAVEFVFLWLSSSLLPKLVNNTIVSTMVNNKAGWR